MSLQGTFTGWSFSAEGHISEVSDGGVMFVSIDGAVKVAFHLEVKGVSVKFLESADRSESMMALGEAALLKTSAIKIEVPASEGGSATGMLSLIELER